VVSGHHQATDAPVTRASDRRARADPGLENPASTPLSAVRSGESRKRCATTMSGCVPRTAIDAWRRPRRLWSRTPNALCGNDPFRNDPFRNDPCGRA
jgi:hypothetical protein